MHGVAVLRVWQKRLGGHAETTKSAQAGGGFPAAGLEASGSISNCLKSLISPVCRAAVSQKSEQPEWRRGEPPERRVNGGIIHLFWTILLAIREGLALIWLLPSAIYCNLQQVVA